MSWLSKAMHGDMKSILKLGAAAALAYFGGPEVASMFGGGAAAAGSGLGDLALGGTDAIGTGIGSGLFGGGGAGGAGGIGGTGLSWGDLLKGGVGLYGAHESSKPGKFKQVPESQEQIAFRNYLTNLIQHSPTQQMLGNMLSSYAKGPGSSTFHLPTGANGYQPYQSSPADYSSLISSLQGNTGGKPPVPPTTQPTTPPPVSGPIGAGNGPMGKGSGPLGGGMLSPDEQGAFTNFIRQRGKSAGDFVINMLGQYPHLGLGGAMALHGAGGQPTDINPSQAYGAQPSV